ncbi:hypothetical protein JAAARDRAFT_206289 [Jaapia argillacea MUCL 33604]|uniref:NmrA-like domain-containing protein n=1 Tax=Jaapia argillacea MUCL 33604 TaxID=933084 RepID=A0A067PU50_9AGAM|nr:hypothetical protein JAAARDRAFT_206289 [Jaapia argillacea MUCL 33604]
MSDFKTFAVAGAGNIGHYIIEELLKLKHIGTVSSVVVLTRESSAGTPSITELAKQGAKIAPVDYSTPSSLAKALDGIDVVISALGGVASASEGPLIEEAKKAGVKLFVPSDYGIPTDRHTEGPFSRKVAVHKKLKEIDLPYSAFHNGPWSDWTFNPYFGWDIPHKKVTISGDGDALISFTTRKDVARFISHVLTAFPREKLFWRTFRIEGDRRSLNQIAEDYQTKTGVKLEITRVSRADLEAAVQNEPQNIGKVLQLIWDRGEALVGETDQLANVEWPEWNPTSVIDALVAANPQA